MTIISMRLYHRMQCLCVSGQSFEILLFRQIATSIWSLFCAPGSRGPNVYRNNGNAHTIHRSIYTDLVYSIDRSRRRRHWEVVNSKFEQDTNFKWYATDVHVILFTQKLVTFDGENSAHKQIGKCAFVAFAICITSFRIGWSMSPH